MIKRSLLLLALLAACGDDGSVVRDDMGPLDPIVDGGFFCVSPEAQACLRGSWWTCDQNGEFLQRVEENCTEQGKICLADYGGCVDCNPGGRSCDDDNNVVMCNETADGTTIVEECEITEGEICRSGRCVDLCDAAIMDQSYVGCTFFAADLDNAAIGFGRDASSQQFAVVVSNPSGLETEVVVEVNDAPFGEEPVLREVERVQLLPGDLETIELPRREVDGSSSNQVCSEEAACPGSEVCVCVGDPPCFCRVSETASGLNDGTHSALSSQAYRIRSTFPIIAYQFNPLDNAGVFSNDASLLLPTSAIGDDYTVVSWMQTIADGDCDPSDPACAEVDFDTSREDEDLRATLTIVGTEPGTQVSVTIGPYAGTTVGGGGLPALSPGDVFETILGPFDVINIESDGLNTDFTGTRIEATAPVSVFVGSEASDAPRFATYTTRRCCADHLEEQLFSNQTLGSSFSIARMPPRTVALNDAFLDPTMDSVAEVDETEWIRIIAVGAGTTTVTTTLPPPDDRFDMAQGDALILPVANDFLMSTVDSKPLAVLQVLPSQQSVGIPNYYPGDDPAIIAVPPIEQYRQDYVFLTPDKYAFDFVVITAFRDTQVELDGRRIDRDMDTAHCTTSDADGIDRAPGDPPSQRVVYRCQLSFPDIQLGCDPGDEDCLAGIEDGDQDDGVHTIRADGEVGVVIYGFDAFVSYAYAAGLDLEPNPI